MTIAGNFDLQVNGYAGVDFNADGLTAEALHSACAALEAGGVEGILATVITDRLEAMESRLVALASLRGCDPLAARVIVGIHIEGPFLNEGEGYRGVHPANGILPANVDVMERLLEAAGGLTRLVTLAPERDPSLRVTRMLAQRGVVVSAGHTDAGLDELRAAVDAGLTMFTHVGNGCPGLLQRHDNIIQRALSLADCLWLCFIADGVHIPFFVLHNYLSLAGHARAIIVTDAMAAAGHGAGRYTLGKRVIDVGPDLVVRAGTAEMLAGSAGTMADSEVKLRATLGLSDTFLQAMMRENPRRALKLAV